MTSKTNPDPEIERLLKAAHHAASAPASPGCVDADVLAAWADRELGSAEAARVERHLSGCARCQAIVAVFARSEPAAAAVLPFSKRWPVRVLAPLAAASAAVLVWSILPARQSAPPSQTVARVEPAPEIALPTPPASAPAEQHPTGDAAAADQSAPVRLQQAATTDSSAQAKIAAAPSTPTAPAAAPLAARAPMVAAAPPPPPAASQPQRLPNDATAEAPQIQTQSGERSFSTPPTSVENLPIAQRSFTALSELAPGANGANRSGGGSASVVMDGISTMETVTAVVASPLPPGAAGGRGGRAGGATAVAQTQWRILAAGGVQRSTDGGRTWIATSIVAPVQVTAGAATSASICWLVGPRGLVFLATDGRQFTRVPFPENVDLRAVRATDAERATVTAVDGRTFTTLDGGQTWN